MSWVDLILDCPYVWCGRWDSKYNTCYNPCAFRNDEWHTISCMGCGIYTSQCKVIGCYKHPFEKYAKWYLCPQCFQVVKQQLIVRRLEVLVKVIPKSTMEALYQWIDVNWDEFNKLI